MSSESQPFQVTGPPFNPKMTVKNIESPKIIWLKGGLLSLLGAASSILLLIEARSWRIALLLAVTVWAFCRAYYFAFYVIGRYVDPTYKFSGLGSFLVYALCKHSRRWRPHK